MLGAQVSVPLQQWNCLPRSQLEVSEQWSSVPQQWNSCQNLDFFILFRSGVWRQRDGRRLFRLAVPGCFPDSKGVLWLGLCAWNNCLPDPLLVTARVSTCQHKATNQRTSAQASNVRGPKHTVAPMLGSTHEPDPVPSGLLPSHYTRSAFFFSVKDWKDMGGTRQVICSTDHHGLICSTDHHGPSMPNMMGTINTPPV